jgi:hypothetical protein
MIADMHFGGAGSLIRAAEVGYSGGIELQKSSDMTGVKQWILGSKAAAH